MAEINSVVLVGRLTRDAELKYTQSGIAIVKFSIAINRRKKTGDQWTDEVNFFDIDMMGKAAEAVNKYLKKGKVVGVQGELRQQRWESDGQARSKVGIFAHSLQLLSPSGANGSNSGESSSQGASGGDYEQFEDDIPF